MRCACAVRCRGGDVWSARYCLHPLGAVGQSNSAAPAGCLPLNLPTHSPNGVNQPGERERSLFWLASFAHDTSRVSRTHESVAAPCVHGLSCPVT
eukprot:1883077-Pleurochrysis_carterae.AAC.1